MEIESRIVNNNHFCYFLHFNVDDLIKTKIWKYEQHYDDEIRLVNFIPLYFAIYLVYFYYWNKYFDSYPYEYDMKPIEPNEWLLEPKQIKID